MEEHGCARVDYEQSLFPLACPFSSTNLTIPQRKERMLVVYARSWTLSSWSAVAVVVRDRERWSDLISCGKEQVLK